MRTGSVTWTTDHELLAVLRKRPIDAAHQLISHWIKVGGEKQTIAVVSGHVTEVNYSQWTYHYYVDYTPVSESWKQV